MVPVLHPSELSKVPELIEWIYMCIYMYIYTYVFIIYIIIYIWNLCEWHIGCGLGILTVSHNGNMKNSVIVHPTKLNVSNLLLAF